MLPSCEKKLFWCVLMIAYQMWIHVYWNCQDPPYFCSHPLSPFSLFLAVICSPSFQLSWKAISLAVWLHIFFFFFNKQENKSGHLSPHQDRKLPFPYHYKTSPAFLEVLEACVLLVEAETKNRKNVEEKGRVYERSLVEVHWDSV